MAEEVHARDGYPPVLVSDFASFLVRRRAIGAWVAEDDGAVVGHVALHPDSSPQVMELAQQATECPTARLAVVARLLVSPACRRKGVGAALLSTATDHAHSLGRWPVLDVSTRFLPAIRLYEREGWWSAGAVAVTIDGHASFDEFVYVGPPPPS
jgi:GNAT superfamily N-acetyltransferase